MMKKLKIIQPTDEQRANGCALIVCTESADKKEKNENQTQIREDDQESLNIDNQSSQSISDSDDDDNDMRFDDDGSTRSSIDDDCDFE